MNNRLVQSCIAVFLAALVLVTATRPALAETTEVAETPREFRAAWVATVDNIDWPSRRNLSTAEQQRELIELLDIAKRLNLNALIFQVRPNCDALYASELEPWSEYLTGKMGRPPEPFWDPLEFVVREAHARGIELHAWFNPYRALHPAGKGPVSLDHVSHTQPEVVREYGKYLWLDPGEPGASAHTLAVILDVVRRYDIDGVHFDDYFYPYPIPVKPAAMDDALDDSADNNDAEPPTKKETVPFPDDASWQRALAAMDSDERDELSRGDWRRQNVNDLIERVYHGIKQEKPWVKFGVSPFGIWRPGHPPQIKGFDQYTAIYADARTWLTEGWVDYLTPQLYWAIGPPEQSYAALLDWWHDQNAHDRHLWPGNFTSRLLADGKRHWKAEEVIAQIWVTRAQAGAGGNVHFSMKALARNADGIADKLLAGPYQTPALVPESPWLPSRPLVEENSPE
jgi:uncharacterized lipoprotein YddW (UPF0748 family)